MFNTTSGAATTPAPKTTPTPTNREYFKLRKINVDLSIYSVVVERVVGGERLL